MAERLTVELTGLPGIEVPARAAHSRHVYWRYALQIDTTAFKGGLDAFAGRLRKAGILCAPRYIQKPAYQCEVLRDRRTFGKSQFPFRGPQRAGEPEVVYDPADTPQTFAALSRILVLPWNERFTEEHVEYIAQTIRLAVEELAI
jgi:dTDP-4-amino-4,6-dideoxygalactose transaminase